MNIRISAISLGLGLCSLSLPAKVEETQPEPLSMFLVHSEQKPGTYYFSNEQFPDLGFIHSDPDLLIE